MRILPAAWPSLLLLFVPAVPAAWSAEPVCANLFFSIYADFDGGDVDRCRFERDDYVELAFLPEDDSVDDAFAWFAFRVVAEAERDLKIKLRFPGGYARFWPKISRDGSTWAPAADDAAKRSWWGKSMSLVVTPDADGLWVAAQELLTADYYEQWFAQLDARPHVETAVLGRSVEQRPIRIATTEPRREVVLLLGRQHPVEVPGTIAMRRFTDVLLADTGLAQAFRERFMLLVVPLLNPDGVAGGHARHNSAATDLNRDWGPFTQPETKSVARLLEQIDTAGRIPRLVLDFHATRMTPTMLFYTQEPGDDTVPALFATHWLTRARQRLPGYEFSHAPRAPSGLDNAKNYLYRRYKVPAITYEIGDEADRESIVRYTPVFAEEMMRVMLESTPAPPVQDTAQSSSR